MPRLPQTTFKLLQAAIIVGSLAGCGTEPEARPSMMGDGKMDMSSMKCQEMMKGMAPDQMKMMQSCMGSDMGMMGSQNMGTAKAAPQPQKTDSKADAAAHAQHHPDKNN